MFTLSLPRVPRKRRRLVPTCERLETLALLSTASPTIGGTVYVDKNNDGHFEAGEAPLAGTKLELLNSSGKIVGTVTTGAKGTYSFSSIANASPSIVTAPTPQSITTARVLPASLTNISSVNLGTIPLFDSSLGTLLDVKIKATVVPQSSVQLPGENASIGDGADISGSVMGSFQIVGVNQAVGGPLAQSTPERLHATIFDGTLDYAGTSGVTFPAAPPPRRTR